MPLPVALAPLSLPASGSSRLPSCPALSCSLGATSQGTWRLPCLCSACCTHRADFAGSAWARASSLSDAILGLSLIHI
eukprot:3889354-Alexandrium_andersonii.AAC.1